MSVKADTLRCADIQKKAINKDLRSILSAIDNELIIARDNGKREIVFDLPISFSIPYMSNSDAQSKVYAEIIKSLKQRGFYPYIFLGNDKTLIKISWYSDEDRRQLLQEKELIAQHSKKLQE